MPRQAARDELVRSVIKVFPDLEPLATSKEAAPEAELSDLELYADTFLPHSKNPIGRKELAAAREALVTQITRMIDSPLVRHGGLDRKQAAPFVIDAIRVLVKATYPAARQNPRPKSAEPIQDTPIRISLVKSNEGSDLIAKWKNAADYSARRAVGNEIVDAATEGARVIIELGWDQDVRKDYGQIELLSRCLARIGEASKPALLDFLDLPNPLTSVHVSRAIAAWSPASKDGLFLSLNRENESQMIVGLAWVFDLGQLSLPTAAMKSFVADSLDHPSLKVQATAVGQLLSMFSSDRSGNRKSWITPPIDRLERTLDSPDATVRAAGFRFFAEVNGNTVAYAAARRVVHDVSEDGQVRYAAARALAANAPDDDTLIQEAIKVEGLLPRIEAGYVDGLRYRELPDAIIPILCRWLLPAEDHYMGSNAAAALLKKMGPKAVPGLLENVAKGDWSLVCRSLSVLSEIPGSDGSISQQLRPRLGELRASGPRFNLDSVFQCIAKSFPSEEAFETLVGFGDHPEAKRLGLWPAIEAIGQIRPVSDRELSTVRDLLLRPDDGRRFHAIRAAGNMGTDGVSLVGALLDIIDRDPKEAGGCLYQIDRIGGVPSPADFRRLIRLTEDGVVNQHDSVTRIVGRVLHREPAYFETIRLEWKDRRDLLLRLSLANIRAPGVGVLKLPAGIEEQVHPLLVDQYVRGGHGMVQNALVSVGTRNQRVIDEARRRVADENPSSAEEALKLMAQLRPVAEAEKRLILESLESDDMSFRRDGVEACGYLGVEAASALPRLIQLAETPGDWGRFNAIRAIGEIAPASPEILEMLQRVAEEPIPAIRAESERAQSRIAERHAQPK